MTRRKAIVPGAVVVSAATPQTNRGGGTRGRKQRNITLRANNVNVTAPKVQRPTRRNKRITTAQQITLDEPALLYPSDPIEQVVEEIEEAESGAVAPLEGPQGLRSRVLMATSGRLEVDPDHLGWYFKYLDPAGAVETNRAFGEFSKIPDGLVKFSVDAEMRIINNEKCPTLPDGSVPLDGALWSLVIISPPCYRTAYIAVANTEDKEIGDGIASDLCEYLNNLLNWRAVVDADDWFNFTSDETWFVRIRPWPPTYDMPDPTEGLVRSVTDYRLTYKSLTCNFNAPTLVDQGWWVGGHVAVTPSVTTDADNEPTLRQAILQFRRATTTTLVTDIVWENLPQGGSAPAGTPAWIQAPMPQGWFSWRQGSATAMPAGAITYTYQQAGPLVYWPGPAQQSEFAVTGDVITITADSSPGLFQFTITNTTNDAVDPIRLIPPSGTQVTGYSVQFTIADLAGTVNHNKVNASFPPLTMDQITANNPKMEQCELKNSMGAYLVHSKMRNPVFQLTPASNFGGLTWNYPGYDQTRDSKGYTGIRDSFDQNMSTGSVVFRGMAHAATIVVKGYQGWEGVTATHTPLGQFAHAGQTRNQELLDLSDTLAGATLTGIYPATDNFAGAVASIGAGLLKNLFKSEATSSVINNLAGQAGEAAQGIVSGAVKAAPGLFKSIIGRIGARVRARRARRNGTAAAVG